MLLTIKKKKKTVCSRLRVFPNGLPLLSWFFVILLYFFYRCVFSSTFLSLLFHFVNPCKVPVPVSAQSLASRLLKVWV